jgi:protein O-GlcNAc transferase
MADLVSLKTVAARLHENGAYGAAYALYEELLAEEDEDDLHSEVARLALGTGHLVQALTHIEQLAKVQPDSSDAWWRLTSCRYATWDLTGTREALRQTLSLDREHRGARSLSLYLSLFDSAMSPGDRLREHQSWGECFGQVSRRRCVFPNNPDPTRPLRVGYVAQAFTRIPEATFLGPILRNHRRENVTAFAYSSTPTERVAELAEVQSRDISALEVTAIEDVIARDQIDVLINCDGAIDGRTMQVFARRAAPVQVSHPIYPASTGLSTMDYRLTDWRADEVPDRKEEYSERLYVMSGSMLLFSPAQHCPEVGSLPVDRNGFITFGAFHNPLKLNPGTLYGWAATLRGLPGSRIVIHHALGGIDARSRRRIDSSLRKNIEIAFGDNGVGPDRLAFVGALSHWDHLDLHNEVDILLDAHPFSGYTTTLEALWMGVPVITFEGSGLVSRISAIVLRHLGLESFIAKDEQRYIEIAVSLANEPQRIRELRGQLRAKLAESPLMDATGHVRNLEAAYRQFWHEWLREREAVTTPQAS